MLISKKIKKANIDSTYDSMRQWISNNYMSSGYIM